MPAEVSEREIEAAKAAIRETTISVHTGAQRSLAYYASVGMDYLRHDSGGTVEELLDFAVERALQAAAAVRQKQD